MSKTNILLEVKGLKKFFPIEKGISKKTTGWVKAVNDVDLTIYKGETLGLVGESGCGKTTLGRCLIRLIEPTDGQIKLMITDGQIIDILSLNKRDLRKIRKDIQIIFQDPYSSLNPRMTTMDIISEPLVSNRLLKGRELEDRVKHLIEIVGLEVKYLKRYPHAFSGGQRQRIGIARALATNPKFIVADEPVSALDVSVQAQNLNLLKDIQNEYKLTFLFISHDLSVVQHISDRVAVMYVGKIIELAKTNELFNNPKHPYTEALLSAVPVPEPGAKKEQIILTGDVANPADPPPGCSFHPRCRYAEEICREKEPVWNEIQPEHYVRCHFAQNLKLSGVLVLKTKFNIPVIPKRMCMSWVSSHILF